MRAILCRRSDHPEVTAVSKSAADRNLLFGLLALQNGMIEHTALLKAFQAWTLAKDRSMAGLLLEQRALTEPRRALLDGLLREHVVIHCGDVQKSLAAVAAGKSTRESLASLADPDINATLAHIAVAHASTDDGTIDQTSSFSVGSSTSDGQRFRVLRPHARGGLGAVFVALDTELNREVALKQILDHHADDPGSRKRFLIEAEITGGLEHPGIVPVYGLGSYGDGRPYYAMRFIKGDSLKEAIERFHNDTVLTERPGLRSLELRRLLRRFTDVCNAIDYAHSRGVLHRDIKPGNVIVGKHGEVLVVDWGLAKPVGRAEPLNDAGERTIVPSSASGSAETLPGSVLGTPAYMSPEQASGDLDRLGPRSDVYSLGATLYCLLTGKPPFEGDDLGEMLRKVRKGEYVRPREIDPDLDQALEAVCRKAMAIELDERYTSCRALAEDVERWMADEPVLASPEPLMRRVRRWAKQNRTAVTAAGAALVAGLVGLSAVVAVQTRANTRLSQSLDRDTDARTDLAAANDDLKAATASVQARYRLSVDAIKTFHTGVSEDFLVKQDQFKDLRDRLLKSASDFYGKLGALLVKETDFASRRALAQANFEVAGLTAEVGRPDDALAAHRAVLAERQTLSQEPGADAGVRIEVGQSLTEVAGLLETTGKTEAALSGYQQAETLLAGLATSAFASAARAALAKCRSRMASFLSKTGKNDQALAVYRLARSDQEVLVAIPEPARESRRDLADTIMGIGQLLSQTGKQAEAAAEYPKAIAIQQKLADENPGVTDLRDRLANGHTNLGILLYQSGKPSEAQIEYRKAMVIQQKLADDNPAVNAVRSRLANSHHNLGLLLSEMGGSAAAEAEYRKAMVIQQKLADDNPAVPEFRNRLSLSHNNLGLLLSDTGKPADAETEYRRAMDIQRKLADDNPTVTDFKKWLAVSHDNLARLLLQIGKPSEAEAQYRTAIAIQKKLSDENPTVTDFRKWLAHSHHNLGAMLGATRPSEAQAEYLQALALNQKLSDDNPASNNFRFQLAVTHQNVGSNYLQTGKLSDAECEYRTSIEIQQKLAGDNPGVTDFHNRLAESHNSLGMLLNQTGRPAEAEAEYRLAMAINQKLSDDNPAVTDFRSELAFAHDSLGVFLSQTGKPSQAQAEYRQSLAIRQKLVDENPNVAAHRFDLVNTLNNNSDLLRHAGNAAEARGGFERALALSERLVRENPEITRYRSGPAWSLRGRAMIRRQLADSAGAAADLRRALAIWNAIPSRTGDEWFETACNQAALAGLAGREASGVSAAEARLHADATMALLKKAVALGFRNANEFRIQDALDPLRDRPDFRLLILDLSFPANPFAR
jgi:serine/threonine protein kinase/tetratricopeptide (TPR) repeat protein